MKKFVLLVIFVFYINNIQLYSFEEKNLSIKPLNFKYNGIVGNGELLIAYGNLGILNISNNGGKNWSINNIFDNGFILDIKIIDNNIYAFNNDGKTYIDPNQTPLSEKALGKKEILLTTPTIVNNFETGEFNIIEKEKYWFNPSYLQRQSRTSDNVNKIKPDFRKASRKARGFINDPSSSYDYLTTSSSYDTGSLDSYYYSSKSTKRESNQLNDKQDYIPFSITINDDTPLRFRAYLDDISDSYQAGWNPQSYMGRAEKFYKYNSFDRDISFGFTIVADNETNLNEMYYQLNVLAASLTPTYSGWGYMSGNIHKLTIGDYVKDQPGILTSLTYSITTESPWGIENNKKPFYIKVTGVKFIPIHEFRPEYKSDSNKFKPIYQIPNSNKTVDRLEPKKPTPLGR